MASYNHMRVRVGQIRYINVLPIYYGFNQDLMPSYIQLISESPSHLNQMMADGSIDISPISSFAFAQHQHEWLIFPDLSISCCGPVMSVILVSHVPLEDLNNKIIALSEESATAAGLLMLLLSRQHIFPTYESKQFHIIEEIQSHIDAALVIGDSALKENWKKRFPYIYDLGAMWYNRTHLPFVFAIWVVRKTFFEQYPEYVAKIQAFFNQSKKMGIKNIHHISKDAALKLGIDHQLCKDYYDHFSFDLFDIHMKGLMAFYDGLHQEGIIPEKTNLQFVVNHEL